MKNIKNTLITFIFLFTMSCVFGQESKSKKKRIISLNMYKSIVYHGGSANASRTFSLGDFTPSVSWGVVNEGFSEIEITDLNFFSRNSGVNIGIGIEYSHFWKLAEVNDSKFNFFIGTGVGSNVLHFQNYALETSSYPFRNTNVGVNLSFTPLLKWDISDKYFLKFSLPYSYYKYSYHYSFNDNPSEPVNLRSKTSTASKIFPNDFTVKVGIGINF